MVARAASCLGRGWGVSPLGKGTATIPQAEPTFHWLHWVKMGPPPLAAGSPHCGHPTSWGMGPPTHGPFRVQFCPVPCRPPAFQVPAWRCPLLRFSSYCCFSPSGFGLGREYGEIIVLPMLCLSGHHRDYTFLRLNYAGEVALKKVFTGGCGRAWVL